MRYLSRIFRGIPEMLVHWLQVILIFLYVCQSGSWYTSLLKSKKKGYLQLWMKNISEFLWTHSWNVGKLVPNNFDFLAWNSNISVLPGLNLLLLNTIVSPVGHLLRPLVLLILGFGFIYFFLILIFHISCFRF